MSTDERLARYVVQIMNGAPPDPAELAAMVKRANDPRYIMVAQAIHRLYHLTDSGFDPVAVATEMDMHEELGYIGGLPGLMVMVGEHSDKCSQCGQSMPISNKSRRH